MAIKDLTHLDGVTMNRCQNALVLILIDELEWNHTPDSELSELDHLTLLKDKLNAYIAYVEEEQYRDLFPHNDFYSTSIEIHFEHEVSEKCMAFLQSAKEQLASTSIQLDPHFK